jgi:L-malate glycosyltransferase
MKILFVLARFEIGGAERHTVDLAAALARAGEQCALVSVKPRLAEGLEVGDSQGGPHAIMRHSLDARGYFDPRAVARLRTLMRDWQPDIVVTICPYTLSYASLARALCRRRPVLLLVSHFAGTRNRKEKLQLAVYKYFLRRLDGMFFVCEHQQLWWRSQGIAPHSAFVVYNGVDGDRFNETAARASRERMRAQMKIAPHEVLIVCCAMLRWEKNHGLLLEAIHVLRSRGLPVRTLLVGDGPERAALQARCTALGIGDAVHFAGQQQRVEEYIAAADVAVLCSTIETFSIAALEQMAMGLPMVLSNVGGAPEMVRHGVEGLLFPSGDRDALADALAGLMDPAVRQVLGAAAARRVREQFLRDGMFRRYHELFRGFLPSAPIEGTASGARA